MKRTNKRGAIGLSVNFIVMFILAISVFALGMTIANKIFGQSEEIKKNIDESTQRQIEQTLMKSGQKVVIPISQKDSKKGGKDVFAIGIKNEESPSNLFDIQITCSTAYTKNNEYLCGSTTPIPDCDAAFGDWFIQPGTITVEPNERKVSGLFFKIPKSGGVDIKSGTYVFNVKVMNNGDPYDTLKKVYITLN